MPCLRSYMQTAVAPDGLRLTLQTIEELCSGNMMATLNAQSCTHVSAFVSGASPTRWSVCAASHHNQRLRHRQRSDTEYPVQSWRPQVTAVDRMHGGTREEHASCNMRQRSNSDMPLVCRGRRHAERQLKTGMGQHPQRQSPRIVFLRSSMRRP